MNKNVFRTRSTEALSEEELKHLVDDFLVLNDRYERLKAYYLTKNPAIMHVEKDDHVPNNKVCNSFAKYITDTQTGYFMGQPVAYGIDADGSEKLLEALQDVFDYNDEQTENLELARNASIYGIAYEMLYIDEDKKPRFVAIDPATMFCVYDTSVEDRILYAVRTYAYKMYSGVHVRYYEVYDAEKVSYYVRDEEGFRFDHDEPHYFGDVPVVVYDNNSDSVGDFEPVISLIDAYDKMQSNTLNDMEYFTDAYLYLKGYGGTTKKDVAELRDKRVLDLDSDGEAGWLVKSVNDAWVENMKTRVQSDIHKFSATPDMTDENFAGNSSGVALQYKLMGLEQIRATKERYFKKGLLRRIELLCNLPYFNAGGDDFTKITMQFNNTLPQNTLETSQIIGNLSNLLSDETLLSLLPFVEDPAAEIEKKEKQSEERAVANYDRLMGLTPHEDEEDEEEPEEMPVGGEA